MPRGRIVYGAAALAKLRRVTVLVVWLLTLWAIAPAGAANLSIEWDPPLTRADGTPLTDLAGYHLHYGTTSTQYTHIVEIGPTNSMSVDNLIEGQTYYFALKAVDSVGAESQFSDEMAWNSANQDVDSFPDAWETNHFGTIDASAGAASEDYDQDGQTDVDEWVAGSNPAQPDSTFSIQAIAEGGQIKIVFPATKAEGPGYDNKRRMFVVEHCAGDRGHWTVCDGMAPIEGSNQVVNYSVAGNEVEFYRLQCWLETTAPL